MQLLNASFGRDNRHLLISQKRERERERKKLFLVVVFLKATPSRGEWMIRIFFFQWSQLRTGEEARKGREERISCTFFFLIVSGERRGNRLRIRLPAQFYALVRYSNYSGIWFFLLSKFVTFQWTLNLRRVSHLSYIFCARQQCLKIEVPPYCSSVLHTVKSQRGTQTWATSSHCVNRPKCLILNLAMKLC